MLENAGVWKTGLELKTAVTSRIHDLNQQAALDMLETRNFVKVGEQDYRANENAIKTEPNGNTIG